MGKLLFVVLICAILAPSYPFLTREMKDIFTFLRKFYQAPVTRLISNSTAHEVKPREDEQNPRRDESPTTTLSPTFKVSTKNFPVNPYMANVVFQLFGKDGILEKGGFSRSGYILRSAAASVVLVKTFGDRRLLLDKVLKAKQAPIRDGGLAVVIQLFFSNSDYINFVGWLRQEIRSGYVNYDDPCSPVVVIRFICCTPNGSPLLAPEFGTLRVDID